MANSIGIIFDIDGTLIDVSESYPQVVIVTTYIYCEKILGMKDLPMLENWFTIDFIQDLKNILGFNNDYVCASALINFIVGLCNPEDIDLDEIPLLPISFSNLNIPSITQLKDAWKNYLEKTFKIATKLPELVLQESNFRNFIKNTGLIEESNFIERIFQEIYYGSKKFKEYYKIEAKYFTQDDGYYKKEKLLIPESILKQLKNENVILGIFTGRPKNDLDLLFNYLSLNEYFNDKFIVTLTDVLEEEKKQNNSGKLSKPNPWGLTYLKTKFPKLEKIFVIGDSLDDLQAAFQAGMNPILYKYNERAVKRLNFDFTIMNSWEVLMETILDLS